MVHHSTAKLTNPYLDRVDVAKSFFGVLATDITLKKKEKKIEIENKTE